MAERFPPGHGPKLGTCPECGCQMQLDWKCTILEESHCTGCGMVYHNYRGVHKKIERSEVKALVDVVFKEINQPVVDAAIFIKIVDQVAVKANKYHIPIIRKKDLENWGYMLEYGMLKKR
jgi:hypothetical protein